MAGELIRGRVGQGPYGDDLPRGQVLRGRVGQRPRDIARQLRDALEDDTPDEEIDAGDAKLEQQGLDDNARVEKYAQAAKQRAVQTYAVEAQKGNPGAATKTERVFALIGDLASGLGGRGPSGQLEGLRAREAQGAQAQQAAAEKQAAQDAARDEETAEAEYIEGLLREGGLQLPEGASRKNPKAFRDVYGPVVGERLKARTEEARYQRERGDKQLDYERSRADRVEDREDAQLARSEQAALTREQIAAGREIAREGRTSDRVETENRKIAEKKAEQTREVEEFAQSGFDALDRLEKQIEDQGTFEAFGPEDANFERYQLAIANAMARLADPGSVNRPSEVEAALKGLPQKGLGQRNSTALAIIQSAREELEQRRRRAYKIRGIEDPSSRNPAADVSSVPAALGPAAAPAQGGGVVYRVRGKGRITLDPAEVDAFLAKYPGAEKVQ